MNPVKTGVEGFTLVEFMVSETIALLLIAGLLTQLGPVLADFGRNNASAQIQETGRLAIDHLDRAIRGAGYQGCHPGAPITTAIYPGLPGVSPTLRAWAYEPYSIRGFSVSQVRQVGDLLGESWQRNRYRYDDREVGDVVMIQGATGAELRVAEHLPAMHLIRFHGDLTTDLQPGSLLQLNNCSHAARFQIDQQEPPRYLADADVTLVSYHSQRTINCENAWTPFGGAINLGAGNSTSGGCGGPSAGGVRPLFRFDPGTRGHIIESAVYFVGDDATTNQPALKKTGFANNARRVYTQSLVEGVENMRFEYGAHIAESSVVEYLSAEELTPASISWDQIVSVRLSILIRSSQKNVQGSQKRLRFPDRLGTSIDCRQEQPASIEPAANGLSFGEACPFDATTPDMHHRHTLQHIVKLDNVIR